MKSASEIPDKKDKCIDKIMTALMAHGLPLKIKLSRHCVDLRNDIINDLNENGYYARVHQELHSNSYDCYHRESEDEMDVYRAKPKTPKRFFDYYKKD